MHHLFNMKTEQNRAKFPHIKDAELAQRRRIVEELVTKLRGNHYHLTSICASIYDKFSNPEFRQTYS